MVPFALLGEFAAHKEQFLAGVAKHEAEIRPQVGKLLPAVTGHLGQQRTLAMHNFVVRQRQHKVLVECVDQAKGHLAMVVSAMNGVTRHVGQRIVHPAHIPLVVKAQATCIGGTGHRRKRSRLFSQGDGLGPLLPDDFIHAFEK